MSTTTNHRINLVVDEKMQQILDYFRAKYPLLKDSDLVKMAVSGFYTSEIEISSQDFEDIQISKNQIQKGQSQSANSTQELLAKLKN